MTPTWGIYSQIARLAVNGKSGDTAVQAHLDRENLFNDDDLGFVMQDIHRLRLTLRVELHVVVRHC